MPSSSLHAFIIFLYNIAILSAQIAIYNSIIYKYSFNFLNGAKNYANYRVKHLCINIFIFYFNLIFIIKLYIYSKIIVVKITIKIIIKKTCIKILP